jgi:hypothetical protein
VASVEVKPRLRLSAKPAVRTPDVIRSTSIRLSQPVTDTAATACRRASSTEQATQPKAEFVSVELRHATRQALR